MQDNVKRLSNKDSYSWPFVVALLLRIVRLRGASQVVACIAIKRPSSAHQLYDSLVCLSQIGAFVYSLLNFVV